MKEYKSVNYNYEKFVFFTFFMGYSLSLALDLKAASLCLRNMRAWFKTYRKFYANRKVNKTLKLVKTRVKVKKVKVS